MDPAMKADILKNGPAWGRTWPKWGQTCADLWPDAAGHEAYVRTLALSGGCTYDVTPQNILGYSCSASIVERDLKVRPSSCVCAIIVCGRAVCGLFQSVFRVPLLASF
jgi:hypothetical protein